MEKIEHKDHKWRSTVFYTDGISISQNIFSKDIVKHIRETNSNIDSGVNMIHSYVLPYVLTEARKQSYKIASVIIKEVQNDED